MDDNVIFSARAALKIKEMWLAWSREQKNPGGIHKRGSVSIGLSTHVVKLKTAITARSGTTLGTGEVYLCETDSDGLITDTTIVKTAWNEGANAIALSTVASQNYTRMTQTVYGNMMVIPPDTTSNACSRFDGVNFTAISNYSTSQRQYLAHGTSGCLEWVSGSTCT